MISTNVYLHFSGNCEEALTFYEKTLGGKIILLSRYGDGPMPASPESRAWIMHGRMTVGGTVIMASDTPKEHFQTPQGFNVNVSTDNPAEAERIFAALSEGGTTVMAMAETFWAQRFGMCTDRFGTPWMVNCEKTT